MRFVIYVILIKALIVNGNYNEVAFLHSDEETDVESTATCVLKLSSKYLVDKKALKGNIVIINLNTANSTSSEIILKTIHHGKKYSIMAKDSAFKHKNASLFPEKAKNYMMILEQKQELLRNIHQLNRLPTWNPLAKVVVYIKMEADYVVDSIVKELINEMKDYQMLRTVVLVDMYDTDEIKAYYCKPYSPTNCLGPCDQIRLLDVCTPDEIFNYENYTDIIPRFMDRCPLNVYAAISEPYVMPPKEKVVNSKYEDEFNFTSGIEVQLLKMITDITNMTLVFHMMKDPEDRGTLSALGNATGLYEKVRENIADLIIGNLEVNKDIRKWLDVTSTYAQDEILWCVHKSGTTSTWSNLITIFTLSTWLTTVAAVALAAFIFHWFLRQEEPNKSIWPTRSILVSYGMILGLVMHLYPKNISFRIIMMTWLLFSLNLNTSYQSLLRSFLINPKYDKQIGTESEIISFGLSVGGKPWIRETFKENKIIYDNFKVCDSLNECVMQMDANDRFAIAVPKTQMIYQEKLIGKGRSFIYCFDKNNIIYNYGVVMLARKFFPLTSKFNKIIQTILECGLVQKWTRDSMRADTMRSKSEVFPLGMNHMLGAFYVLLIGHGICGVVLIIEIIYHKCDYYLRKRRKIPFTN